MTPPPDSSTLPRACQKVAETAAAAGQPIAIRIMEDSTRTAEEAAAACQCELGQIVKSLVFQGADSGNPVLLLVSGANRVREKQVSATIGEKIIRPDAAFVRERTGFAIGGIPPFGHASSMAVYMDEDLFGFDTVFAAAGTPSSIFAIDPNSLQGICKAERLNVTG
ncbi:MAG: YbaK/EbsC family protein [Nitratireductor sp.]|nr:YbaK/EbsC family protein [Nitratireductor sp.]